MKLIGLAGKMGSGKDTVAALLKMVGYERFAFADELRREVEIAKRNDDIPPSCLSLQAYEAFDFAPIEEIYAKPTTPRMRALLQEWGTEYRRSQRDDYWVSIMREKLAGADRACISDVRFPNEANLVRELGGRVWVIERPGTEPNGHASEAMAFKADYIIHNTGSIEQLAGEVLRALRIQEGL